MKIEPLSIISIIIGVPLFIFLLAGSGTYFLFLALILMTISYNKFKKNPNNYSKWPIYTAFSIVILDLIVYIILVTIGMLSYYGLV
jgi:hypothetical protein